MALKICKYTTFELWEIPPGDILLTLKIQKQFKWYAVLDEDDFILSTHKTFAEAKEDVKCRFKENMNSST